MKIQRTKQELDTRTLSTETVEVAVEQVKVNGYVIFEKVIDVTIIKNIHAAFQPLFEEYTHRKGFNAGKKRTQMHLPFAQPFIADEIIANPVVIAIMDRILGKDCRCTYFASDTPLPGAGYQAVHSDCFPLFPELTVPLPTYALVLNIPLVDTNIENGPLEIWPGGTHLNPDNANHVTLDGTVNPHLHIVRAAEHMVSEKVLAPAGSIIIRDLRMWHRGTPNRSDAPRPNLSMIYNRSWYGESQIHIPEDTYQQLSERAKELFRSEIIGFPVKMPWEW